MLHVVFEQGQIDIERIDVARPGIVEKTAQITAVSLTGVGRKTLLKKEVLFVVLEQFGVHRQASQVLDNAVCTRHRDFVFCAQMYEE